MTGSVYESHGLTVFLLPDHGPPIQTERDAVDVISEASGRGVRVIAVPIGRLSPEFFDLKTQVAGGVLQKFLTYHFKVAIVGDISEFLQQSGALRDFVTECNRGSDIWWVARREDLDARLQQIAPSAAES